MQSISPPRIAVVLVTHACRPWLGCAINSILQQTYPRIELIVADDGSCDVDEALRAAYPQVTFVRFAENVGPFRGLRQLWRMSDAPLIAFQDADDWSVPRRIERQVRLLVGEDLDACGTWIRAVDLNGDPVGYEAVPPDASAAIRRAACHPVFHPAMLYRRAVLEALGDFDDRRFGADTEFLYRACFSHQVGNVQRFDYVQTVRPSSLTQRCLSRRVREGRGRYREALEDAAAALRQSQGGPPERGWTLLGAPLGPRREVPVDWVRPASTTSKPLESSVEDEG